MGYAAHLSLVCLELLDANFLLVQIGSHDFNLGLEFGTLARELLLVLLEFLNLSTLSEFLLAAKSTPVSSPNPVRDPGTPSY